MKAEDIIEAVAREIHRDWSGADSVPLTAALVALYEAEAAIEKDATHHRLSAAEWEAVVNASDDSRDAVTALLKEVSDE